MSQLADMKPYKSNGHIIQKSGPLEQPVLKKKETDLRIDWGLIHSLQRRMNQISMSISLRGEPGREL
jgi:hypothetical protein